MLQVSKEEYYKLVADLPICQMKLDAIYSICLHCDNNSYDELENMYYSIMQIIEGGKND
jgi:hypothetical protein